MKTLWFKQRYVESILCEEKTFTIRAKTNLKENDIIALSVGPRPSFAHAKINRIEQVHSSDLSIDYQQNLRTLNYKLNRILFRIDFKLIQIFSQSQDRTYRKTQS